MLTEKECRESLSDLYNVLCSRLNEEMQDYRQDFDRLGELIREHFYNPSLEWDEIKVNDVIFDKELKETIKIKGKFIFDDIKNITFEIFGSNRTYAGTYEENRFYRKEVVQK